MYFAHNLVDRKRAALIPFAPHLAGILLTQLENNCLPKTRANIHVRNRCAAQSLICGFKVFGPQIVVAGGQRMRGHYMGYPWEIAHLN